MDLCTLLDVYVPDPHPSLVYHDPFTLLIAVMLSAHSTDVRVNAVTPALFKRAPTPFLLSIMSLDDIEDIIRPCGLMHRKAKALQATANEIVERFLGNVPNTVSGLISLPGVGRKTALVVLSLGFNIPTFPVDTHVFRVARRWGLSQGKNVREVEEDLCAQFPKEIWTRIHLQMIAYARKYCPALHHKLALCPICQACGQRE